MILQECGKETVFCQQLEPLSSFVPAGAQKQWPPVFVTHSSCLPLQAKPADRVQESDFSQPAVRGVGL